MVKSADSTKPHSSKNPYFSEKLQKDFNFYCPTMSMKNDA